MTDVQRSELPFLTVAELGRLIRSGRGLARRGDRGLPGAHRSIRRPGQLLHHRKPLRRPGKRRRAAEQEIAAGRYRGRCTAYRWR